MTDISHVIQLAIAPVFLLTALGTILGVLSNRLARIVDRSRVLNERHDAAPAPKQLRMKAEMQLLKRRRGLINTAITAGTMSALLVCLLIAVAFVGALVGANTGVVLSGLFVLAMMAFVAALLCFLREVLLASTSSELEIH